MKIYISLSVDTEIRADKKKLERDFRVKQKARRFVESQEDGVDRATERVDSDDEEYSNSRSGRHSQ